MSNISNLRFFSTSNSLLDEAAKIKTSVDNPSKIQNYWREHIQHDPTLENRKEYLIVIPADTRLNAIGHTVVSTGTINQTICHPVEVLRPILLAGVYHFILLHNHPSGNTNPSPADDQITRTIQKSANIFQIKFIDHVIVGSSTQINDNYYSFQENGKL